MKLTYPKNQNNFNAPASFVRFKKLFRSDSQGLGDQCITLEKFIILVIEYSLDTKEEGHVYLLEDGLQLLAAYIDNVTKSDEILSIFPYLPIIIGTYFTR